MLNNSEERNMSETLTIDKVGTAVLIMDYQNDIVALLPEEQQKPLLQRAARVLDAARQSGLPVTYVRNRFRDGYPEVSPHNMVFSTLKQQALIRDNTPGADICGAVAPKPGEVIVTKCRSSALYGTELQSVLQTKKISKLVLFGVRTSGCVLSTVRHAADMDYDIVVISDCCADADEEIQQILVRKIFPKQTTVVTAEEFLSLAGDGPADKS
jgi:nicotinamidase-related amidase